MRLTLETASCDAGAPPAQRKTKHVIEVASVFTPLAFAALETRAQVQKLHKTTTDAVAATAAATADTISETRQTACRLLFYGII